LLRCTKKVLTTILGFGTIRFVRCNIDRVEMNLLRESTMYNVLTEQFSALHKAGVDQWSRAADLAFEQTERAFAFQVGAAKQLADEVLTETKNVADVKDVQALAAIVRGSEGKTEKFATFGKAVYDHAVRTQAENVKFVEAASAEMNAAYVKFIDNVAKSVPVGGDAFAQQFKQFVAAQQNAAAQASQAFKQASTVAQSNWKNAAAAAQDVVVKAKGRK
jgi:hypothetical protein